MRKVWMVVPLMLLALAVGGAAAEAQKKESQLRTVRGQVVDKQNNTLASAIVYLKNLRTQSVKTYISDDTGSYHFSGLDPNVDYELHAENKDSTSSKRTISSFDERKDIVVTLKVDKKKSDK